MKLLLINPKFPESFWTYKFAMEKILSGKRYLNPPLGLASLAALSPQDWEIEVIDENIESIPLRPEADIVGVCGMGVQFKRQQALLTFYRKQGYYVVAGGSYASLCPEEYETLADTVVAGESEYIWPEFCNDYASGDQKKLYHETGTVSLHDCPVPRFDLLKLDKYSSVSLQFSRGCPFRCEFCDIIVMFGRKPRTKTHEQVGRELDELRKQKVQSAFFVDDNLIGNKKEAKALLRFLVDYQKKHDYSFSFGTEASMNMASDDELLGLFREANFEWVFIGIESPDEDSLKETLKLQNVGKDMIESIRHIYSYGIEVLGGFIVGFDNDTVDTFEKQFHFIMNSGIQSAMIGLLVALPKTPLHERLQKEGRVVADANSVDNTKMATNIIPKNMSYDEMVEGYHSLYRRLLDDRNIALRLKNKIQFLKNSHYRGQDYTFSELLKILGRFAIKGILPGGVNRMVQFFNSIPLRKPWLIPLVIKEWIIALSMKDYMERHFVEHDEPVSSGIRNFVDKFEFAFQRYLHEGSLEVSLGQLKDASVNFSISIKGLLGSDFFGEGGKSLEKLLSETTASLTLRIEEFSEFKENHLEKLLQRLSRYGDRINIAVHESLRDRIVIDSSVFNLILEVKST
ncbi:MAG: Hopanoid C-2 methylase [Candidatus Moanabacter tarae]|uniref:Hopanoid C-2 methylase n=1 Tax=Candidatus Moanibacter tarae TaxID=2200854 RepID=A0A2Z4AQ42_9BACT|nr:MAG: Hopanoid C-2 methylase [Candidatus Moanabacter tarae]|tara:strand:+ start:26970 stop:28853 length:1884 start_codon:yes stop_codon:yes gene_type:complete